MAFEDEPYRTFNATAGMLAISPAGVERKLSWSAPTDSAVVGLSRESMAELAGHELDRPDVDLRPMHFTPDNTAFELARLIKSELGHPDYKNELYLDSLITMLGIHVLRNYSGVPKFSGPVRGGLSAIVANRIREYLHEHFRRKLSIAELAGICGLSPGYFTQAFTKTFGSPPHRYVLERRLEFAEKLLAETGMPVAEVAYLSGFSSQSHLTNMLRAHKGKTPSQYR
ncbi:helix-turn-helix domain-containing protein [Mesorhizobium sp. 1B3]|uniref:helix-turn-helix domain-containing protein n=1 Tax=Mesorhizobium sp. 1B3 TaxID=3243599 RepID=UPI003D9837DA